MTLVKPTLRKREPIMDYDEMIHFVEQKHNIKVRDYAGLFGKAILGPMPFLKIVPTNGVHTNNVQAWLKAGAFAVGFVNNLFEPNDMAGNRFDKIEERAKEMLAAACG